MDVDIDDLPLQSLVEMDDPLDTPYIPEVQRGAPEVLMRSPAGPRELVHARARSAAALLAHGMEGVATPQEGIEARRAFRAITESVPVPSQVPMSNPAVILKLAALLGEYDHEVVQDAEQIRRYTINRLLEESAPMMPPSTRMQALKALGSITEVGLFTERTEITIKTLPMEQLESELHKRLITLMPDEYQVTPNA